MMKDLTLENFCALVSRHGATAGGGSAAFLSLALGSALVEKAFVKRPVPQEVMAWLAGSRAVFLDLIQKDADMFNEYLKTRGDEALLKSCETLKSGLELVMGGPAGCGADTKGSPRSFDAPASQEKELSLMALIGLRDQVKASIKVDYNYGINLIMAAAGSLRDTLVLNVRYVKDKAVAEGLSVFVGAVDEYLRIANARWT